MFDEITEQQMKKYGLTAEDFKGQLKKYLSFDEKWTILENFFNQNKDKSNIFINSKEKTFTLIFPDSDKASKFALCPSSGLAEVGRKYLTEHNKKIDEYDLFFNLLTIYDDSSKNKKPNIVTIRAL